MKKNKLFTLKQTAKILGISKKELKTLLIERGLITKSLAVVEGESHGLLAELCVHHVDYIETTLLLTFKCVVLLVSSEVYNADV